MISKSRQAIIHVLCWIAFLAIPLFFTPPPLRDGEGWFVHSPLPSILLFNLLLILFFYFSYSITFSKFYIRKKYFLFLFISVCGIILVSLLPHIIFAHPHQPMMNNKPSGFFGLTQDIFMTMLALVIAVVLKNNEQLKQIEKEKMTAELSSLKAQINPHFLFNTLNSIYSQTLGKADNASEMLLKLSAMMRYTMTEAHHDKVSITQELNYINNYIELQKVRLSKKIKLEYTINNDGSENQITPFLLIPSIENAFKYGVNSEQDSYIKINLQIQNDELHLQVFNNKVEIEIDHEEKTGLGIENTRKRLALLYPAKHKLTIANNENDFTISLQINLA